MQKFSSKGDETHTTSDHKIVKIFFRWLYYGHRSSKVTYRKFKVSDPLVPEDHQLAELDITGTNIWGGTSAETLSEITPEMLSPVVPDPIYSIFNLTMFDFVLILLVFMLVAYILYRIVRWYFSKP